MRWGPNHVATVVLTTMDEGRVKVLCAIEEDEWIAALPEGFVKTSSTGTMLESHWSCAFRTLSKAAFDHMTPEILELESAFYTHSCIVHTGVVDDPRNTDNAWIETCAVHVHVPEDVHLDVRGNVVWMDADECSGCMRTKSHSDMVKDAVNYVWRRETRKRWLLAVAILFADSPNRTRGMRGRTRRARADARHVPKIRRRR